MAQSHWGRGEKGLVHLWVEPGHLASEAHGLDEQLRISVRPSAEPVSVTQSQSASLAGPPQLSNACETGRERTPQMPNTSAFPVPAGGAGRLGRGSGGGKGE